MRTGNAIHIHTVGVRRAWSSFQSTGPGGNGLEPQVPLRNQLSLRLRNLTPEIRGHLFLYPSPQTEFDALSHTCIHRIKSYYRMDPLRYPVDNL